MHAQRKFMQTHKIRLLLLLAGLLLSGLFLFLRTKDSYQFRKFSEELFLSELSGNTLSLHYTLAYPEEYGFPDEVVLSSYTPGEESGEEEIRAALSRLSQISRNRLKEEDAYTYDLLVRYFHLRLAGLAYDFYSEPLSPSSGMQAGLPVLLADYTFRSAEDVEDYLKLLDQTDTYFAGLLQYEQEKSAAGLFMSDSAAEKVISQCTAIMDRELLSSQTHFLHTTFSERLSHMEAEGLITAEQKNHWISENDRLLTTVMEPAYEKVADAFILLKGSGTNAKGLYYFPKGRDYYEYLLASLTGSSRSIAEIKEMLFADFQKNYAALLSLFSQYPQLATFHGEELFSFPYTEPEEMLEDLRLRTFQDFPSFPQTEEAFVPSYTVKRVSSSMENYCSPAYYLTPPIDDMTENIIYINHKNAPDALTLYTTLAHEGYPGHLYQTVYSQLYETENDIACIRHLLHYGGYVEGWALYVENMSYDYARSLVEDKEPLAGAWCEACRLNRNLQLCLYSLLDIAIHYKGATPAQVQEILGKIGITNLEAITAAYEYIVEEPANYPKYYVGFLEFLSLKEKAMDLWGDAFTLQKFHRLILETGPSDFQGLHQRLDSSIISSM